MGKMGRNQVYHSNESLNEIIGISKDGIGEDENSKLVAFEIPLLKYIDIREELTLSEYIIYLIILSFNLKGEFFRETNTYISNITGIKLRSVEKSISKLISKELVMYLDETAKEINFQVKGKPLTSIEFKNKNYKGNDTDDFYTPRINDKRELIVNYVILENMIKNIPLTIEEKVIDKKNKKALKEKEGKLSNIVNTSLRRHDITIRQMLAICEKKTENQKVYETIAQFSKNKELTITDLIQYLRSQIS